MNKEQQILHLSHTDIRFDSRILKELKALSDLSNCKVSAYGINDESENRHYAKDEKIDIKAFEFRTKKWYKLPRPIRYFCNYVEAMICILPPAIKLKPTVVHCHDTLLLPLGLIIKLVCSSKLLYDAHELESNKNGQSKMLSWVTLLIEKIAWSHIDLLITVSPSIIDWYCQKLGKKESLLILNAPELRENQEIDAEDKNYLRFKFNIPNNKKVFLYLGIIGRGRSVDIYLDVFSRKDINSHIVFMGYGEYVEKIEKFANSYDNIHYHPAVSHEKVVGISSSADIGLSLIEAVSLSDYYCLPNKLFEYAFAGLYVLASDYPDMRKLVSDNSLGTCTSLEPDAVFDTVKQLEQIEIIKGKKDFYFISWAHQAEKLVEAYKIVLK